MGLLRSTYPMKRETPDIEHFTRRRGSNEIREERTVGVEPTSTGLQPGAWPSGSILVTC